MSDPETIRISVNNKELEVKNSYSISDLLKFAGYTENVAVFVNNKKLMIRDYLTYYVNEEDNIIIFKPLGGGDSTIN